MFGPNSIVKFNYKMAYSHRSDKFKDLYQNCRNLILEKFNLKEEYDLVFIPGSGTTGMEAVISSLKNRVKVVGHDGKFKQRWEKYCLYNNKIDINSDLRLFCQLETSTGEVYAETGGIVDAISSFPYYDIPKKTKCFVTCSNKQLKSFPGLALVFVKKDSWDIFQEKRYFCTKDIFLYKKYSDLNQTPTTCPVQIFKQLNEAIRKFDIDAHRNKINNNCKMLGSILKTKNNMPCPVVNVAKSEIPKSIAIEYGLYNFNNDKDIYQIFSYSNKNKKYKELYEKIKNEKNN